MGGSTPDAPVASVIVLNYNGLGHLGPCLAALAAQDFEERFEVILVDNASGDGSVEWVRTHHPWVRVVEVGANLGFAGGNNAGIDAARGEFLITLNNDTRATPGWLRAMVAAARSRPDAGAVAGKLVFMNAPGVIQNAGSLLLSDGSGADRGFHEPDTGQYERMEEVFGACGASMLLRRAALDDVGRFDDRFFMYYEDTDLNWRLRLRGWKVVYQPEAVVLHVHAGSSGEWSPMFTFHVDRNRLFMLIKNAPPEMVLRAFAGFGARVARHLARAAASRLRAGLRRLVRGWAGSNGPGASGAGSVPAKTRPRPAGHHLRVLASLLRHLPGMLRSRWRIRRRRLVGDAEIRRWLYPRELWDRR